MSESTYLRRAAGSWGALALLTVFGCAGADRGELSLESPPEEWQFLDTVRIGSVAGPDDALTRVGALVAMPGGGAWFTQPDEQQIRIVDEEGRLAGRAGGRGQGPGEFTTIGPLGFWHGSPDTVWVQDWVLRRISLFLADGAFVRTLPMPEVSWGERWSVNQLEATGPGWVALALGSYAPGTGTWDDGFPLLRFTLPQGEVLGEVARVERTGMVQIQWKGAVLATGAHPFPDSPIIGYSPDGRLVAITERATDRVDAAPQVRITALEAAGDTAWQRSIAYDPEPIPSQEVDSIWGARISSFQQFARLEGRIDADEARRAYLASVPVPSHRPPVDAVRVDSEGRLLLLWSADPGQARQGWVIAPGGDLVAWLTLPGGQELLAFEGDYLWALEHDEMEVPFVLRYRVGPGAGGDTARASSGEGSVAYGVAYNRVARPRIRRVIGRHFH